MHVQQTQCDLNRKYTISWIFNTFGLWCCH